MVKAIRRWAPRLAAVGLLALPASALAQSTHPTSTAGTPAVAAPASGQRQEFVPEPGGLPYVRPTNWDLRPPHFTTNAWQAIAAAEGTAQMRSLHRREHPLLFVPLLWNFQMWEVLFNYHGHNVAAVDVARDGRVLNVWQGATVGAVYARGHFGALFDSPWVVLTFALAFLIPFIDPRRPLRMLHLDAVMLLSIGLSYYLFDHAHINAAVLLVYPPLLYLLGRGLYIGLRRSTTARPSLPRLPLGVLAGGLVVLVGARIGLNIADPPVMDVGFASVTGAARAAHGLPLYYNTAADLHYDTYGPINYLAYLPFVQLIGWSGVWDTLPAAHVATLTFDLLTVVGLVLLGTRLRPGRVGWRLGLTLGWAWSAFPFTLLGVMKNTNDGLIALLLVWSLVAFASPVRRGLLLALATAAKFVPAILLPLYIAGRGERGSRGRWACAGTFLFVVVGTFALYLPSGGPRELYDHTLGFQLGRSDVFSLWTMHPSLTWLKVLVEVAVAALALALMFLPRRPRSMAQVAALACALMVAVQLPAMHWFYFYIVWYAPFAFVALFAREIEPPAGAGAPPASSEESVSPPPLALGV